MNIANSKTLMFNSKRMNVSHEQVAIDHYLVVVVVVVEIL
jgi:hypothetical protein